MRLWIPSSAMSPPGELLVLRMRLDIVGDERAKRWNPEALAVRVVERGRGEPAAEAAALARLVHLGVREGDAAVAAPVGGEADQAAVEAELVAAAPGHLDDLGVGRRGRPGRGLELAGAAEVLDQLPGRVRLARVAVVGEAVSVLGSMLRGLTLAQVREDRSRAAEEAAVLGLEHRNLIAACDLPQPGPLARPRLDLARDEVEPELGQHLAHRRGERAPLGLVERQHPDGASAPCSMR